MGLPWRGRCTRAQDCHTASAWTQLGSWTVRRLPCSNLARELTHQHRTRNWYLSVAIVSSGAVQVRQVRLAPAVGWPTCAVRCEASIARTARKDQEPHRRFGRAVYLEDPKENAEPFVVCMAAS